MITGRIVAGVGSGGLDAIATFVASDLVPLRKRGVVHGFMNICYGIGCGLGGLFGGWVNDTWGWRVVFLILVPLTMLSAFAVFLNVPGPTTKTDKSPFKRIDFLGAITFVIALVLFLLGMNSGGNTLPWTHPLVLTSLPLSAVFLAIFIYVEEKVAVEPIIPLRLLLNRTVAAACLTDFFDLMAVYALFFYGPIYFQVRGLSTTQAGERLIPQTAGAAMGSLTVGLLMQSTGRYYLVNVCVESLLILSTALISSTFTLTTPSFLPFIYFAIGGFGYGGILTTTLVALVSAVKHTDQAVVTSAAGAARSAGATLGITLSSTVFQNVLNMSLWKQFGGMAGAEEIIRRVRESLDEIGRLPSGQGWKEGVLDCYMHALRSVFIAALIFATLGGTISLFMREHKLHKNLSRK